MNLTLEVTGAQSATLGHASRKVFAGAGGSIGRLPGNQWVLQHPYVSSRHALVSYANGVYTIEDTRSANGVFINSLENRLPAGEKYVLKDGDTIFIDPFEIRVALTADTRPAAASSDPFEDLFALAPVASIPPAPLQPSPSPPVPLPAGLTGELDPMSLLGLDTPPQPPPSPRGADLNRVSALNEHYRPPAPPPPVELAPAAEDPSLIPEDWLRTDESLRAQPASLQVPRPGQRPSRGTRPPESAPSPAPDAAARAARPRSGPATGRYRDGRPAPPPPSSSPPPSPSPLPPSSPPSSSQSPPAEPVVSQEPRQPAAVEQAAPVSAARQGGDGHLAAMLAGAGLDPASATPELAEAFGQILRVVVSGLMDVLQARRVIKEEFRVPGTRFERSHNNPLKFSANFEDALHNLLVKRNAAYLGPVEAFEDAFGDLRNHQMAMLAGIRTAFESMLAEFDPERLQEQFDRQMKKGALLSAPAKLRYWDLYREKFGDMVRDAEASFAELFGDEFARAYEEQLERLKAQGRSDKPLT